MPLPPLGVTPQTQGVVQLPNGQSLSAAALASILMGNLHTDEAEDGDEEEDTDGDAEEL